MACETKSGCWNWVMAFVFISVFNLQSPVWGKPAVPCYFVFGDSLVDSGNNNNLATDAKVNYWPYGIDFPKGPTGRFCNGRTIADVTAERLGFDDYIPPFATANGSEILKGVNYASGSAGIRDETGSHQGVCISLNKQLKNHKITISRIAGFLGSSHSAHEHLKKCLYSFTIGSNDYINNYFLPQFYNSSQLYTPSAYARILSQQYSRQLKTLHRYGARKVTLAGIGAIGCTPNATSYYGTNGSLCVDKMNSAVQLFNKRLVTLVDQLNAKHQDSKFIALNTLVQTPPGFPPGFNMSTLRCCDVNDFGLSIRAKSPCSQRATHIFWDSFHPAEVANIIAANKAFHSEAPSDAYPTDIQRLVHFNPEAHSTRS
ncbi:GDSL esterase/lipase At1g29660 [Citrus clementina]|nr:GDSL esterase/lipase At1g29660 [Citrus x clementina]